MSRKTALGVLLAVLALPVAAFGATVRTADNVTLGQESKISDNAYVAGGTVASTAAISGDLVAGGGNILVNGPIGGDLFLGGGSVSVLSAVGGGVRLGGGNLLIGNSVKGDLLVFGGSTQLTGAGVGGDLIWAGGNIRVEAPVGGDMRLSGGDVYIDGPIAGSVTFTGEAITLGSHAVINGDLSYTSPKEVTMEDGAVVHGKVDYKKGGFEGRSAAGMLAGAAFAAAFAKFLMMVVGALALGLFFNRYSLAIVGDVVAAPWLSLGRGFVTFVVLPVASVLLLVTIIGVPLGVLGLAGFVALMIYGSLMAVVIAGSCIMQWFQKGPHRVTWQTILVGAVFFSLLGAVPLIGGLIKFAVMLAAIGAGMKLKWEIAKEWR